MFSPFRFLRTGLCLASLLLTACDGPTAAERADRMLVLESRTTSAAQREGTGLPLTVSARDASGRPVPGVTVAFRVVEGTGTLSAATSVTDSAGVAATTLKLGPGRNVAEAWVDGRAEPVRLVADAAPWRWVEFPADTLVLAGPGCYGTVAASAGTQDAYRYAFSLAPEKPLVAVGSRNRRDPFSHMITGLAPGEVRLIASLAVPEDAAMGRATADTLLVRVLPSVPTRLGTLSDSLWLQPAGLRSPIGGSKSALGARVTGQCGELMAGEKVTYSSTDPEVAEVDSAGVVTTRASGRATLHVRSGALATEVAVLVRRVVIQPADTTVFVGDTVRYRVLEEDATGRMVESRGAYFDSGGDTFYKMAADGLLTATRSTLPPTTLAGDWLVRALAGSTPPRGWIVDARIRIEPRP